MPNTLSKLVIQDKVECIGSLGIPRIREKVLNKSNNYLNTLYARQIGCIGSLGPPCIRENVLNIFWFVTWISEIYEDV